MLFILISLDLGTEKATAPPPVLLPGKSHGRRSLVGCSPWGHEESDMTEQLHFHFSLSCIGEGNGNPLQCSCLENPRDRGAWWAAIYGVAQSRTWLKWLSSSSRSRPRKTLDIIGKCLLNGWMNEWINDNEWPGLRGEDLICFQNWWCTPSSLQNSSLLLIFHSRKGW